MELFDDYKSKYLKYKQKYHELKTLMEEQSGGVICSTCGQSLSSYEELIIHKRTIHNMELTPEEERRKKNAESSKRLRDSIKTGQGKHKCRYCDLTFYDSRYLSKHLLRIHKDLLKEDDLIYIKSHLKTTLQLHARLIREIEERLRTQDVRQPSSLPSPLPYPVAKMREDDFRRRSRIYDQADEDTSAASSGSMLCKYCGSRFYINSLLATHLLKDHNDIITQSDIEFIKQKIRSSSITNDRILLAEQRLARQTQLDPPIFGLPLEDDALKQILAEQHIQQDRFDDGMLMEDDVLQEIMNDDVKQANLDDSMLMDDEDLMLSNTPEYTQLRDDSLLDIFNEQDDRPPLVQPAAFNTDNLFEELNEELNWLLEPH